MVFTYDMNRRSVRRREELMKRQREELERQRIQELTQNLLQDAKPRMTYIHQIGWKLI